MRSNGAARHTIAALLLAIAAPASAQDAGIDAGEAAAEPIDAGAEAIPVEAEIPELRTEPTEAAPAAELAEPTAEAPPPRHAAPEAAGPETAAPPPRGWRYPREVVRRPLTMPQGVFRFDSIVALTMQPAGATGGNAHMSGFVGFAAGIFDELEIGSVPLAWTFLWPQAPDDPYIYLRALALSGDVQLAFRGGVWLPVMSQPGVAQMQLTAELALLATPEFRIDVALDYQLLFDSPLQQRVGLPVTATVQLGIHSISLTSAVFVFNDFDDVDVPLLLGYTVTFRGYRQPIGEWGFEGGFLDLERADVSWTMRSRFTFFA